MKMKRVLSSPMLFLALMISAAAAAEKPIRQERQQEEERDFAELDKERAYCKKLFEEKKYDECFDRLTHYVIAPLTLRKESNLAEKAQKRLKKEIKFQAEILETRGEELLEQAKTSLKNGKYQEAINIAGEAQVPPSLNEDEKNNLAPEVQEVIRELSDDAAVIIAQARTQIRRQERADQLKLEKIDPALAARKKEINIALAAAADLLKHNKLDEAREKIEKVYKLEPGNAEAADLACKLYYQYYKYGYVRNRADTTSLMAYEAWQWVEPTFQRNSGSNDVPAGTIKSSGDQSINSKLDTIVFPSVNFKETDIPGVIAFLRKNKNFDPDKVGVNISFNAGNSESAPVPQANPEPEPTDSLDPSLGAAARPAPTAASPKSRRVSDLQVTLSAKNVTLRQLLDYLCFLTDYSYVVQNNGVVFGETDSDMKSQKFAVMPSAVDLISAYGGGAESAETDAGSIDSSLPGGSGDKTGDAGDSTSGALKTGRSQKRVLNPATLKKFFELYGLTFPQNSSITYNATTGYITMLNTEKNLRMLADLLRELNEDKPMVQIEVKSIHISDQDYQELGFNWTLGTLYSTGGGSQWAMWQGDNATYNQASGTAGGLSMLRSTLGKVLDGVDSRLLNNLNLFPDIFGSFKPFGSDVPFNLSLTINALDRNSRTEMVSAPKVLTSNNQKASVFLGKAYYFPTDWDELEIETEGGDGDSGYSLKVTAPTPTFGESEEIGTRFTVTPTVLNDNYTIRLNIKPTIKAYTSRDIYTMTLYYKNSSEKEEQSQTYYIWKPVITTHEVDVQIDVYDGETLVLGGLADSKTQSRLDKIPILGDLPLVGRLFQSHSEYSKRVNILFFVTARLVNYAGLPIRRLNSNGGIPEVNR